MLIKMGYTPGTVLGKTPTASGLAEPIRVEVKETRSGLGHINPKVEPNVKKPKASKAKKGAKKAIGNDTVGTPISPNHTTRVRVQSNRLLGQIGRVPVFPQQYHTVCRQLYQQMVADNEYKERLYGKPVDVFCKAIPMCVGQSVHMSISALFAKTGKRQ
jgi:hypothetical protein